jgi:hypothetical protein
MLGYLAILKQLMLHACHEPRLNTLCQHAALRHAVRAVQGAMGALCDLVKASNVYLSKRQDGAGGCAFACLLCCIGCCAAGASRCWAGYVWLPRCLMYTLADRRVLPAPPACHCPASALQAPVPSPSCCAPLPALSLASSQSLA